MEINKNIMETNEKLVEHLKNAPHIEKIWLNENGEWLHHKHKDFLIEKTREEILNEEVKSETKSKSKKQNNEKDS